MFHIDVPNSSSQFAHGSLVTGSIYIFKLDPSLLKAISCSFQNFFTDRFEAQRFILSFVQFRSIIWNKRRGLRLKIEIDQYLGKISGRILKGGVQVETKSKKLETLQSVSKFGFYYRLIRYPNFINFSGFFFVILSHVCSRGFKRED